MKKILRNTQCPACSGQMQIQELACETCEVQIRAQVEENEFSLLDTDNLHFLRIFVHCDGRIRDMESALGLSYPSIKSKLVSLKNSLKNPISPPKAKETNEKPIKKKKQKRNVLEILQDLEDEKINSKEAIQEIKKHKNKEGQ